MADSPAPVRSERRLVTALFADVTGSTHMAEGMDPEDWTDIMNRGFAAMIEPIEAYGGHVARLMGDGLLALFGAPVAHEDDPQRAVLAGLGIIEGIGPLRSELAAEELDFNVRVGINSGMTIVGTVGTGDAAEYTAMGDAVNVAARMEQTAIPGTVQISLATYRFVQREIEADPIGPVDVKGKTEPVKSYRVRRRRTRAETAAAASPLIGRNAELAVLENALADLKAGIGGVVALVGDAGIGKTRLIQELRTVSERDENPVSWFQAGGLSYDHTRPFSAVINRTTQLYGVEPGATREQIRQAIDAVHGDFAEEIRRTLVDAIHDGFSARVEGRDDAMTAGELRSQIAAAFTGGIRASAEAGPALLVFDDLQWLDSASAELIRDALALAEELPVLFVASVRPARHSSAWAIGQYAELELSDRYTEIVLDPLDKTATDDLISQQLGVGSVPRDVAAVLHRTAEGNPLFIEELTRSLIESGAVVHDATGPRWDRSYRLDDGTTSPTIQALLISRIDRLDPAAKRLLQTASVIGHEFSFDLLAKISGQRETVDSSVEELQRSLMLAETARVPERRLAFRHELLRQVAYESILRRDRRRMHLEAAAALAELGATDPHELARHYLRGGDTGNALDYSLAAGKEALRLSSHAEAVRHFADARDLLPDPPVGDNRFVDIEMSLGRSLELASRHHDALAGYQRLESVALEHGLPHAELAALVRQAVVKATINDEFDPPGGRAAATKAQRLAAELGDPQAAAKVEWALLLLAMFGERDYGTAVAHGERGLTLARQLGDTDTLAYLVHDSARANLLAGAVDAARPLLDEARALWEQLGNSSMLADSWAMESDYLTTVGELEAGRAAAEQTAALAAEIGSDWLDVIATGNLFTIDVEEGRYEAALERIDATQPTAAHSGLSDLIRQYAAYSALIIGLAGDPQRGLAELEGAAPADIPALVESRAGLQLMGGNAAGALETLDAADPARSWIAPGLADFYRAICAEIRAFGGNATAALKEAQELERELEQAGRRLLRVDALYVMGVALARLGRGDEALEVWRTAGSEAAAMGNRRNAWRIAAAAADVLEARGDSEAATDERRIAEQVIRDIAAGFASPDARKKFLSLPAVAAATDPSSTQWWGSPSW